MQNESDPESTALVEVARHDGLELLTTKLDVMLRGADALRRSGLAGDASAEQVLAKILMGRELGMGPMASLRSIHVVKGRPTLDAAAQLARAIRAGVVADWKETNAKIATLVLSRSGRSFTSTWTIEMAVSAGLTRKDGPWLTMPWTMLRARAITSGIRAFCPDVLDTGGALYSPDEVEDIGRVDVAPKPAAWTAGEHHVTFAAVSQSYAIAVGDYSKVADWLESEDDNAAKLRRGIAAKAGDGTLEQPWRPSWVPPRAREVLLAVLNGKHGPTWRANCAAWHAKSGDIDVEFEPVDDGKGAIVDTTGHAVREPSEKPARKPRGEPKPKDGKPAAKVETQPDGSKAVVRAEPDPLPDADELLAMEQTVGREQMVELRSACSIGITATHEALLALDRAKVERYVKALQSRIPAEREPGSDG